MIRRSIALSMLAVAATATAPGLVAQLRTVVIVGEASVFAPNIASTAASEVRLTLSKDGRTALWFSRNRPGGPGGYDIWMSRRTRAGWSDATPVPFNSPTRDFDPAFSADGRFVYFCSDRPGGLGGDDVYRVAVTPSGFGEPEHLDSTVNSPANEFAPMLSPDGARLLFASNRAGGAGKYDLYVARRAGTRFEPAVGLPGAINSDADEFDATFLSDGRTIVFSRTPDMKTGRVDLYHASPDGDGRYDAGVRLPMSVNDSTTSSYGPMLDWSRPDRFTFSAQRRGAGGMDLYLIRYRLRSPGPARSPR